MLVLILFAGGGVIAWAKTQYSRPGPLTSAICVRIDGGQKVVDVARNLSLAGAVTSQALFRMGVDYTGRSGEMKAGSFL
ncbi:MAG: branched-chain alpha-keto acid dehydrogenase subunit E2, partial [Paracoccaceae bacterium]